MRQHLRVRLTLQLAVDEAPAGEQEQHLVGAVDGAPVEAQTSDQLEDQ